MNESDKSTWPGKDFEFLITGEPELTQQNYDDIMTPNSFPWSKINRDGWYYYVVGTDYFTYSWEPPGIQMVFNKEMPYAKAKQIADEVISNILATGQQVELVELRSDLTYRFDS